MFKCSKYCIQHFSTVYTTFFLLSSSNLQWSLEMEKDRTGIFVESTTEMNLKGGEEMCLFLCMITYLRESDGGIKGGRGFFSR